MKRFVFILALFVLLPETGRSAIPSEPGLYAEFSTNHGSFTCTLFFEQAPLTVANFVGLAEGSKPWVEVETGQVRTDPFYQDLTFHRVIADFMIQGGSRNGEGTDGPGYRFPDEFFPGLVHDKSGVLSMANSGFDTNGSQFFITVAPTEWLNYKHAVFGEIFEGMAVVEAISAVATDASNRPVEPVVIHSVEIHRVGDAALAFDADTPALPRIGAVRPRLDVIEGEYKLNFPRRESNDYFLSSSENLLNWLAETISWTEETPETGTYDLTALAAGRDRQFYRVARVDYSDVDYGYLPENLVGRTLQLNLSTDNTFVLHIDDERTDENEGEWLGTGTFDDQEPARLDYLYFEQNNRGRFLFILEGYHRIDADLKFIDQESGTFTGEVKAASPFDVHGTFTLRPQEAAALPPN